MCLKPHSQDWLSWDLNAPYEVVEPKKDPEPLFHLVLW